MQHLQCFVSPRAAETSVVVCIVRCNGRHAMNGLWGLQSTFAVVYWYGGRALVVLHGAFHCGAAGPTVWWVCWWACSPCPPTPYILNPDYMRPMRQQHFTEISFVVLLVDTLVGVLTLHPVHVPSPVYPKTLLTQGSVRRQRFTEISSVVQLVGMLVGGPTVNPTS